MGWKDVFRKKRGGQAPEAGGSEELVIPWVEASDNPWGVRILDVRPVTLGMLATSQDEQCAANAASFGGEDGLCFVGETPSDPAVHRLGLRYRIDRVFAEGPLFVPEVMEHKWALFHYGGKILFVRSWTRQVLATVESEVQDGYVELTHLQGSLLGTEPCEDTGFLSRCVDFLIRSHALGETWPAPLPPGLEADPRRAALWCMSVFGNLAQAATPDPIAAPPPDTPLRSHSLLHLAVARGDEAGARAQLAAGMPPDLLAGDGMTPLHWAIAGEETAMFDLLLEAGSPVDARSQDGATPLMQAVQSGKGSMVRYFLERGADPNAGDARGFTALHRAAEMGMEDMVRVLLAAGANPRATAQGHTPISLAEGRGHKGIVRLLV